MTNIWWIVGELVCEVSALVAAVETLLTLDPIELPGALPGFIAFYVACIALIQVTVAAIASEVNQADWELPAWNWPPIDLW